MGGHAKGTPAILPVTYNDTIPYAKKYQAYAEAGLKVLARETAALAAAVRSGDLAAAKRDWLTAHLQYQTLGAAYGTFGDYDDEIDGRADVDRGEQPAVDRLLPAGVRAVARAVRPRCWRRSPRRSQERERAARLVADAADTAGRPRACAPTRSSRTRCEFQLTGHDDYGSGTTLATTLANIRAPRTLLALLHPLLAPRYRGLPAVYSGLDLLQSLLEKEHLPNGWWVPVSALPASARQAIDAACGAVLQSLAPIASITEPRNTVNDF